MSTTELSTARATTDTPHVRRSHARILLLCASLGAAVLLGIGGSPALAAPANGTGGPTVFAPTQPDNGTGGPTVFSDTQPNNGTGGPTVF